jgi:putative ABC transport system permease protein
LRIFSHLRMRRRRADWERDMAEEFESHLAMHTADNLRAGMDAEEALRAARLKFGGMESVKEDYRDTANWLSGEKPMKSIRYGFRQMRRNPGFAAIVVGTLALAIGVNSAVFSALDAVILKPLPFPDANQLVAIHMRNQKKPGTTGTAPARIKDWEAMNSSFQAITGYFTDEVTEVSGELPERLVRANVGPRFLDLWRMGPSLGHGFSAEEQRAANVVLITDRYWRSHFGANPAAVGQVLRFSTSSVTVAGVLPVSFRFPVRDVDIFQPIAQNFLTLREITYYTPVGRLRPGIGINQARADLTTVQSRLAQTYPDTDSNWKLDVQPLQSEIVAGFGNSLWLLFGAVSLVLLIACINVAALLLVRARQREREVATRLALGATKAALSLQFFIETAILALCGTVIGLGLAALSLPLLRSIAPNLPRLDEVRMDARIVVYSLAVSLAVTLVCGLVPVLRANRVSRTVTARAQVSGGSLFQWALVGAQISLAVVLLVGAGLLVRSLRELGRISSGLQSPEQILTFRITASFGELRNPQAVTRRIRRTMEGLRTIHGVMDVATAAADPGIPLPFISEFRVAEGDAASGPLRGLKRYVSPEYFATLGIPLLSGELCGPEESSGALVNRAFAETYFPGASPVGKHILPQPGTADPIVPITGVVADAREQGRNTSPAPLAYFCAAAPFPMPIYLVRTNGSPLEIVADVRHKVKELEPLRSVHDVMPLNKRWSDTATELRTWLLSLFSLVAGLLAGVGLYGTMSYFANIRRREVGVRMALGAAPGQILREFLRQGVGVATVATLIGLGLSMLLARWLSGMLFGVSTTDPWTLLGVCASVLLVAALASFIPSLRASRLEAMQVLREE